MITFFQIINCNISYQNNFLLIIVKTNNLVKLEKMQALIISGVKAKIEPLRLKSDFKALFEQNEYCNISYQNNFLLIIVKTNN